MGFNRLGPARLATAKVRPVSRRLSMSHSSPPAATDWLQIPPALEKLSSLRYVSVILQGQKVKVKTLTTAPPSFRAAPSPFRLRTDGDKQPFCTLAHSHGRTI